MEESATKSGLWRRAYLQHGTDILAFLHNRLRNREDAEDLLQETFIKAIRSSDNLRDSTKVRSYLFTIAHNLLINYMKRRREVPFDTRNYDGETSVEMMVEDQGTSPETTANHSQLMEKLNQVLSTLTPAHRSAFEMGVLEKKPYNEIARLMDWSLAAVKINVYRARKQVMEELSDWRDKYQEGVR